MWALLKDLIRFPDALHTVVLMRSDDPGPAHHYELVPRRLVAIWLGTLVSAVLVAVAVMAFTPARHLIPGYDTPKIKRQARLSALRVAALKDSLAVQQAYVDQLRALMTGAIKPPAASGTDGARSSAAAADEPTAVQQPQQQRAGPSGRATAHAQPAFTVTAGGATQATGQVLPALQIPMAPPVVKGFPTRGFDARAGHYAIDIAVKEGTMVQSVGPGYVILADWTQQGGYTIAVQHADGYVSVYKHNKRLLKRVGDQVRAYEPIAVTGNTGEITSGPHLHFELWRNGLAQDPRPYFAGW
ncbi:M23 family metallopeptidase [Salisaeta longa]|uniref:M23 family metallopeptidase n=1 Tax=Salisaeta longa TaxID=503170 RepID=UPI0003B658ED|nr:M23 family metallopeptidase [Salisaeta longa]